MMEVKCTCVFLMLIAGPTSLTLGRPSSDNVSTSKQSSSDAYQGDETAVSLLHQSPSLTKTDDPLSGFTDEDLNFILPPEKHTFDDSGFSSDSHTARASTAIHNQILQSLQGDNTATDNIEPHTVDPGTHGSVGDVQVAPHDVQIYVRHEETPRVSLDYDKLDEYPLQVPRTESPHPQTEDVHHDSTIVNDDRQNVQYPHSTDTTNVDSRTQPVNYPQGHNSLNDNPYTGVEAPQAPVAHYDNQNNNGKSFDDYLNQESNQDELNKQNTYGDPHQLRATLEGELDTNPNEYDSLNIADQKNQDNLKEHVSGDIPTYSNQYDTHNTADQNYQANTPFQPNERVGELLTADVPRSQTGTSYQAQSGSYKQTNNLRNHDNPEHLKNIDQTRGDQTYQDYPSQQEHMGETLTSGNSYSAQPDDHFQTHNTRNDDYPQHHLNDNGQHALGITSLKTHPDEHQESDYPQSNDHLTSLPEEYSTQNTPNINQNYQGKQVPSSVIDSYKPTDNANRQADNHYTAEHLLSNPKEYHPQSAQDNGHSESSSGNNTHQEYPNQIHDPRNQDTGLRPEHVGQLGPQYLDHSQLGPQILDHSQLGPHILDHSQLGPHILDHSQLGPHILDHSQLGPQILDHSQLGPQILDHSQLGPHILDHSQLGPPISDNSQIGPHNLDHTQLGPHNLEHSNHGPNNVDHSQLGPHILDHSQQRPHNLDHSNNGPHNLDHSYLEPNNLDHSHYGPNDLDHSQIEPYSHQPHEGPHSYYPEQGQHQQESHQYPSTTTVPKCQTEFYFDFLNNWKERHGRIWMGHTGKVNAVDGKAIFYGTPQSYLSIPFFSGNDLRPHYRLSLVLESNAAPDVPLTVVSNARFQPSTFGIYVVDKNIYVEVVPRPSTTHNGVSPSVVVTLPLDTTGPNQITVDHDDITQDLWVQVNDKSAHAVARVPMISYEPLYIGAGSTSVQPAAPLQGTVSELSFHKCPRKYNDR